MNIRGRYVAGLTLLTAAGTGIAIPTATAALQRTVEVTIPLPAIGQFQLCYKDKGTHIGKCNSSPVLKDATMVVKVAYSGPDPVLTPAADCQGHVGDLPSGAGVSISGLGTPAQISASVVGRDAATGKPSSITRDLALESPRDSLTASACLEE